MLKFTRGGDCGKMEQLTHHRAVNSRRQDFSTKKEIDKLIKLPVLRICRSFVTTWSLFVVREAIPNPQGYYDATSAAKAQVYKSLRWNSSQYRSIFPTTSALT